MAQAPDKRPWGKVKRRKYIEAINRFQPIDRSVTKARILLLGPFGAGKSSFVNSVVSIFRGRIGNWADGGNPTSGFRPYWRRDFEGGAFPNLTLCDTMGLSGQMGAGLHIDDIVSIIQGHVPDGYQFNPSSPITPETAGYVAAPTLKEKIHCVVHVVDASTVPDMSADLKDKLGEIRQAVSSLDIPQLVLMTKVDEADPSVIKDIRNIDQSKIIQEKKEELAALLDMPISCIFPVKNYVHDEKRLKENFDVLILTAVCEMLSFTDNSMDDIAELAALAI